MSEFDRSFSSKKLVFLDLDGTVYLGDSLLPGAKTFLKFLSSQGIHYYFLSNNSSRSKQDYVKKLVKLDISIPEDRIILSTDGVIAYLLKNNIQDIYVVGTQSMKNMFTKAGLDVASTDPSFVILGYDTELTYEKLRIAAIHLLRGVKLLATHPDYVCPTPDGPIPDVGAMLVLFEKATGKKPAQIFGKPNPEMVTHILDHHAISPAEVVMIGDRIYTDMELANRLGCDFILVLSGETTASDLGDLDKKPALVAENLGDILVHPL